MSTNKKKTSNNVSLIYQSLFMFEGIQIWLNNKYYNQTLLTK